jgi:AraC-like DNA-binding protein
VIHIPGQSRKTDEWLGWTLKLLAFEARKPRPGSKEIISRLTGVIFIQVMRAWLEQQPEARGGWFRALRDPQIAAVLAAIHRDPSRQWSVAGLADEAAMSRSSFASRFTSLLGVPPLTYLNDWRLHLAAGLLKRGHLIVSQVAEQVGYGSETSFSKAFKRRFSVAPGVYRRSAASNGEGNTDGEKSER